MSLFGIILGSIIGIIILIIFFYFVSIYNNLIKLKNNIKRAWSNIDVLLKQRHDELIKLMASVKGYKDYEKSVLVDVTRARTSYLNAKTITEKAKADNIMTDTLKNLFAVAENYPDLKANQNFLQFQQRISEIENQLSEKRQYYNDSVNTFNIKIKQIPYVFIASFLNYQQQPLFKATEEDKKDINIKF